MTNLQTDNLWKVSTMTCSTLLPLSGSSAFSREFDCSNRTTLNLVDIAKYLELDSTILGIKLIYAGRSNVLIRGVAKASKKNKDFYNQITFIVRISAENYEFLASCKLFHNGTFHITGIHRLDEAILTCNQIVDKIKALSGTRMIKLRGECPAREQSSSAGYELCQDNQKILESLDNLVFSSKGEIIGWKNENNLFIHGESVVINTTLEEFDCFESKKWIESVKNVYSLDGELIGKKMLLCNNFGNDVLFGERMKKQYDLQNGYLFFKGKIIAKEKFDIKKCNFDKKRYDYLLSKNLVVHSFDYSKTFDTINFQASDFKIHMINSFFNLNHVLNRRKLHEKFLDLGYFSRYEEGSISVNLRYHYIQETTQSIDLRGKCLLKNKNSCKCRDISVSIFASGKCNVTGTSDLVQNQVVYDFMMHFIGIYKNYL
jgi:hypothetical protein